jgi:hypothetical protein
MILIACLFLVEEVKYVAMVDSLGHSYVGQCPFSEVYFIYTTFQELAPPLSSGSWLCGVFFYWPPKLFISLACQFSNLMVPGSILTAATNKNYKIPIDPLFFLMATSHFRIGVEPTPRILCILKYM